MNALETGIALFVITGLIGGVGMLIKKKYSRLKMKWDETTSHAQMGCIMRESVDEIAKMVKQIANDNLEHHRKASTANNENFGKINESIQQIDMKLDLHAIQNEAIMYVLDDSNGNKTKLAKRGNELLKAHNIKQDIERKPTLNYQFND